MRDKEHCTAACRYADGILADSDMGMDKIASAAVILQNLQSGKSTLTRCLLKRSTILRISKISALLLQQEPKQYF